jgi:hypothetical protein
VAGVAYLAAEEHAMTHGPAKRRDIARSVLPSTARKAARRKLAAVKRKNRRAVRSDLRSIGRPRRAEPVVAEYDGAPFNPAAYPDAEINRTVRRRRDADKLGPVFRWAKATTRDLPLEDRLPAIRTVLADNLAGRHALSHLEWDDHFRIPDGCLTWWDIRRRRPVDRIDLRAIALQVLEEGDHAELNRQMKARPNRDGDVPILHGRHDVDAFVAMVDRSYVWRGVLVGFRASLGAKS